MYRSHKNHNTKYSHSNFNYVIPKQICYQHLFYPYYTSSSNTIKEIGNICPHTNNIVSNCSNPEEKRNINIIKEEENYPFLTHATFYVDPIYGNNNTAAPETQSKPYRSITAAVNSALLFITSSSKLIFVLPGNYSNNTTNEIYPINLGSGLNALNMYFQPGSKVTLDTNSNMFIGDSYKISGYAELINNSKHNIFSITSGITYIQLQNIYSQNGTPIQVSGGELTLNVHQNIITSNIRALNLLGGTGTFSIGNTLSALDETIHIESGTFIIYSPNIINTAISLDSLNLECSGLISITGPGQCNVSITSSQLVTNTRGIFVNNSDPNSFIHIISDTLIASSIPKIISDKTMTLVRTIGSGPVVQTNIKYITNPANNTNTMFNITGPMILSIVCDDLIAYNGNIFEINNGLIFCNIGIILNVINGFIANINSGLMILKTNQIFVNNNDYAIKIDGDASLNLEFIDLNSNCNLINLINGNLILSGRSLTTNNLLNMKSGIANISINSLDIFVNGIIQTHGDLTFNINKITFNSNITGTARFLDLISGTCTFNIGNMISNSSTLPEYQNIYIRNGIVNGYIGNSVSNGTIVSILGGIVTLTLGNIGIENRLNTDPAIMINGGISVINANYINKNGVYFGKEAKIDMKVNTMIGDMKIENNPHINFEFNRIETNGKNCININGSPTINIKGNKIVSDGKTMNIIGGAPEIIAKITELYSINDTGIYISDTISGSLMFYIDQCCSKISAVHCNNTDGQHLFQGRYISKDLSSATISYTGSLPSFQPRLINTILISFSDISIDDAGSKLSVQSQNTIMTNKPIASTITILYGSIIIESGIY